VLDKLSRGLTAIALFSLAAFAAGCGSNASVPYALPAGPGADVHSTVAQSVPDACNTTVNDPLNRAGGSDALPACATFTGGFTYGPNNAPSGSSVALLSTTKKPGGVPTEPGTPLLFVQGELKSKAGYITFKASKVKSDVHSTKLLSSKTYTLYAFAYGFEIYHTNLGSPTNGTLKFASPFDGRQLPTYVKVTVEIAQN